MRKGPDLTDALDAWALARLRRICVANGFFTNKVLVTYGFRAFDSYDKAQYPVLQYLPHDDADVQNTAIPHVLRTRRLFSVRAICRDTTENSKSRRPELDRALAKLRADVVETFFPHDGTSNGLVAVTGGNGSLVCRGPWPYLSPSPIFAVRLMNFEETFLEN